MQASKEVIKGNVIDKRAGIEEYLLKEYQRKGFLLEDDIIDVCIDNDLDVIEVNALCDKLLNRNLIVRDSAGRIGDEDGDSYVDRSHVDYEQFLNQIKIEYPNCIAIVDEIRSILPPQLKEYKTLIGLAQNGNEYARERMICMYLRTVMRQAYSFSKSNYCDFEDAFQDGVIGLINAMDKYDITSPDTFSAYFQLWVRQRMSRFSEIRGTIMRYPVHFREQLSGIVNRACEVMEDDDFKEAVEWADEEFYSGRFFADGVAKEYVLPYVDIPDNLSADDDPYKTVLNSSMEAIVRDMLSNLKEKESDILELRYGLRDGKERTLEEVGVIYGVTRERVRQIEAKAIKRLRNQSKFKQLRDFW